jgi:hypothetical protein
MLIEIAETHPPQYGKKVATGGQKYEIWPEKLAGLRVGAKYDVDIAERDFNGRTIRKITKATPVNGAACHDDHCGPRVKPGDFDRSVSDIADEAEFIGKNLAALILKGEVRYDKRQLFDATEMLRGLWGATLGGRQKKGGAA